jgi:hypothetical protein
MRNYPTKGFAGRNNGQMPLEEKEVILKCQE